MLFDVYSFLYVYGERSVKRIKSYSTVITADSL